MKKVIVLGAGVGQLPLIKIIHELGLYVTVVTPHGDYPGVKVADEVLYEDIRNKEKILDYALRNDIIGILTDQLDQSVPTVAYVSEKIKINTITYDTSLKFTDKYYMKQEARKLGVNVPKCFEASSLDEIVSTIRNLSLTFPMVIKPLDGSASNGVFKVYNVEDIKANLNYSKKYSRTGKVIFEEYIEGNEFVVEAYTHDYEPYNLMVGNRDYFEIPNSFIPCATVFHDAESAKTTIEEKLKTVNSHIIKGFGLKYGITHGEYIVQNGTGKVYLIEIAARGGGVFTSSDIIPAATGVNAIQCLVKDTLELPFAEDLKIRKGAGAYFCYMLPEGTVRKVEYKSVLSLNEIINYNFSNIKIGMQIGKARDKYSRKGPIIVKGNTKEDCYEVLDKLKKSIDIEVMCPDGIVRKCFWR